MDCVPRSSSALPLKKRSRAPPPEEDEEEVVAMAVGAPVATAAASTKDGEGGRVTPVYGVEAVVVDDPDGVDVEEVEIVDSDDEEPPVANEELEGDWKVLSGGTVQIGTVNVRFPSGGDAAERGIARFRDVVTQLHSKHAMAPDPDTVLGCGTVEEARPAPADRPMVLLEQDYATSGKFWRVQREGGVLVWRKTSVLKLDECLGWYRDAHRDDATIRESGFLAWTRELPEDARVMSAKELEPPKRPKKRGKGWTRRRRAGAAPA